MSKIYNLIGLMFKAKKIIMGYENILKAIYQDKVEAIIVGSSASFNSIKRIQDKAKTYNIDIYLVDETNKTIASIIKKEKVKMIAITDSGFSNKIKSLAKGE